MRRPVTRTSRGFGGIAVALCAAGFPISSLDLSSRGRPRGNRYRPYTAYQLPSRNSAHSDTRQEDYYGPNQSLFDRESVLDMVASGISYDSLQQQVTHLPNSSPSSSEEKKCRVIRELTVCILYCV